MIFQRTAITLLTFCLSPRVHFNMSGGRDGAGRYLETFGRPISFYTDKASLFQTAEKRKRDEPGVDKTQ